jgi:hypothetical protein
VTDWLQVAGESQQRHRQTREWWGEYVDFENSQERGRAEMADRCARAGIPLANSWFDARVRCRREAHREFAFVAPKFDGEIRFQGDVFMEDGYVYAPYNPFAEES